MILVTVEPRGGDQLYEIHVADAGDKFLVSHQGYENAEDAVTLVLRLFGSVPGAGLEQVELTVRYRSGDVSRNLIR